ncbi:MAG: PAS-domain containing protein [Hyphomicrobiales bacterium]
MYGVLGAFPHDLWFVLPGVLVVAAGALVFSKAYLRPAPTGRDAEEELPAEPDRAGPTEEELHARNALFEEAFNNLSKGLILFDAKREVVFCNKRYMEIYGLAPEQVKPGTSTSVLIRRRLDLGLKIPSNPDAYIRERISRPVTPASAIHEFADGRIVAYTVCPMPNGGGLATHDDITEKEELDARLKKQHELAKEQEEKLRVRNLQFDMAINNMSQGLCFFDGAQRLVVCNNRYVEMYGLDAERIRPGTTLQEIIDLRFEAGSFPDMSREEYHVWRNNIVVSAKPSDTIVELKNGLIFEIRHRPMPDYGWVATHEDITERERAKGALAEQNRRFDAALNNMPHGLSLFDADRRLIVCNRRYAEMYRLPSRLTEPGTTLDELTAYRLETGQAPQDIDSFKRRRQEERAGKDEATSYKMPLVDGRTLQIDYEPMVGGGWVTTHQDITEATRAEARINHLARHDALTDLPNRVLFRDQLDEALGSVPRDGSVAVLCLDLDQFKAVNDTLGHPVGDELLKMVAERLRACLRDSDMVARLGGDEFAIIEIGGSQPTAATSLAGRVIESVSAPYMIGDHQVVVGTSVGIAIAPGDGTSADQLLKNADLALYRAKSDGRSIYRFFEPAMDAKMQARRVLELDLRKAVANEEFELFYQPLISLPVREVVAFEALLRWRHPERGLVSPADFIPLAEEIGLIAPLGAWVLRKACFEAATWPDRIKVTVNLSPIQFRTGTLVLNVASALAASGLSPRRLELEITETVLLRDTDAILAILRDLKALGVSISMDDFGTGYSSLSYLRKFPFDKIKIDQSFVHGLSGEDESLAIVRAVTGLGRSLGMVTTAEGVETLGQVEALRAEGCTEMQGYYFSPPVPTGQIRELLEEVNRSLKAA